MQGSLARMKNNVRAEKQACARIYEVYLVICILSIPVAAFGRVLSVGVACDLPELWPVIYGAFALMTMVLAHKLFRDMHTPTDADVMLSLPMTAKERYFSKLLTLARCILLPYIISMLLTAAAMILTDKLIFEVNTISVPYYAKGIFMYFSLGLLVIMFSAAVSFLCSSFTSSTSVSAVATVFVAAAAGLLPRLILEGLCIANAHITFGQDYKGFFLYYCLGLSPFDRLLNDENRTLLTLDYSRLMGGVWVNTLLSALVLPLGYLVYKRRDKSTLTYNVYAKPFMLGVMSLTAVVAIICGIEGDMAYIPYAMLFLGCAVFALMFWRMGFKLRKNIGWFIGYAGVIAGFMVICAIAYYTEGFGLPKRPYGLADAKSSVFTGHYREDENGEEEWESICDIEADMQEFESIVADVSELCADTKSFYNFCEYSGLVSKESSHNYIYKPQKNGNLLSSKYTYTPSGYEGIEIYTVPFFMENSLYVEQHGENRPEDEEGYDAEKYNEKRRKEAAEYTESIELNMYIRPGDFDKIKTMLKEKYGQLDEEEMNKMMFRQLNPDMTDEEIDELMEIQLRGAEEIEQQDDDPEEEYIDE